MSVKMHASHLLYRVSKLLSPSHCFYNEAFSIGLLVPPELQLDRAGGRLQGGHALLALGLGDVEVVDRHDLVAAQDQPVRLGHAAVNLEDGAKIDNDRSNCEKRKSMANCCFELQAQNNLTSIYFSSHLS